MHYTKHFSFIFLVFIIASCGSTKDLSKYNLNAEERREWKTFQSEALGLGLRHPDDIRISDSENLKNAIVMISDRGKKDRLKFKMVLKELDTPTNDLLLIGQNMEEGVSYQFNYNRKKSGLTNYGGKEAYHHEYTTSAYLGEETRYYSLIFPIKGVRYLVNFEASSYYFFEGKKKLHKILRSIR